MVSSFDPFALVQFHRHLPDIALAFMFGDDQALPLRKGWVGTLDRREPRPPAAHAVHRGDGQGVAHARACRSTRGPSTTPAELARLARLGVDGVFCNDPAHALRVFSELA